MRSTGTSRDVLRACAHRGGACPQIIHHPSSIIHPRAFTLIEVLVVISIIALLLAILIPALRAGRSHARTAKCQGTLRQWGLYYAMYTTENGYRLPIFDKHVASLPDVLPRSFYKYHGHSPDAAADGSDEHYWYLHTCRALIFCPEATTLPANRVDCGFILLGRTHSPWAFPDGPGASYVPDDLKEMSSYGPNRWTPWRGNEDPRSGHDIWVSCLAKGAAAVPIFFDSMLPWVLPMATEVPLPYEDALSTDPTVRLGMGGCTMNRHRGGINSLFMDWSVRKVGVKEPWTLKWNPGYNTAGPWTKAGGVKPEDWPQWMRRFRDY